MRLASSSRAFRSANRAAVPVVGMLLLVVLAVLLAVTLSTVVIGERSTPEPAPTAVLGLSVDGETLTVTHEGGEPLEMEELSMKIAVDDEPLEHQPPVPFFGSTGFRHTTGAFNSAGNTELTAGNSASLTIAETNEPTIEPGATVSLTLYAGETVLIETKTTA